MHALLMLVFASLLGVVIFGLGISVFVSGRPVVLPSRWLRLLMIAAVLPLILMRQAGAPHTPLPLVWILLVAISWRASSGYTIYGISSTGLREALLAVLRQQGVAFEENMTGIVLSGYGATISTSMTGIGIVRLRVQKAARPVLKQIIPGLRDYFRNNKVKMTYTFNILYSLIGLFLVASMLIVGLGVGHNPIVPPSPTY